MRLCIKCKYYEEISSIARCRQYHWISNNEQKPRIYNPMMFECLDYIGIDDKPNFEDDHLFEVFTTLSR